jgi:aspartate racemase
VGREASRLGLKKLGLLGNRPTMTKGFVQSYLKDKFEIETIIPDESRIDICNQYVSKELTQGVFSDQAKEFFLSEMDALKVRGAEGIILGCTELPMLIEEREFDLPMLATTQLHAQAAVDFILSDPGADALLR